MFPKNSKSKIAAVLAAMILSLQPMSYAKSSDQDKIVFYRHPMRPDVTSPVPAKDEMGMDYIPVRANEVSAGSEGAPTVKITPERQQLIGVKTGAIEKKKLTVMLHTIGHVGYDPDFYNMLAEYKELISQQRSFEKRKLNVVREEADDLLELIKLKLRTAGLSEDQIQQLIVYGQRSENLVLPADSGWLYADIYEENSVLVRNGMEVELEATALPGRTFKGIIRSVDEILYAMSHTVRVRIEAPGVKEYFRPGMTVHVRIRVSLGEKLVVPEGAILNSGAKTVVFIDEGEGKFEPREVKTGFNGDGFYEVLSGVAEGDKVVTSANFLVDSEANLQGALRNFKSGSGT